MLQSDPNEIMRTSRVLLLAGDVGECRIPKTRREGVVSGYFDDPEALKKAVLSRNGDAGIYMTLNPVLPQLLARCANRLQAYAKVTTGDKDVLRRRRLLLDFDPVRPSEISSSDQEHAAALLRARAAQHILSREGWPRGILYDSGNGAHLIYFINLPNDEASTRLIENVLKGLAKRFDDDKVKLDQTVYNAGRIVKLWGTVARKGDNIAERPHRLSRLLEAPPQVYAVARELLVRVAATVESPKPPPQAAPPHAGSFNLEAFISRHLKAREPVTVEGWRKWVLEECPFNPDHKAPDAAVFQGPDGRIGFKCLHASCAGKHWADVREHFEGPRASRKVTNQNNGETQRAAEMPEAGTLVTRRVSEVEARPIRWLWAYRIPRGKITLIAGLPDLGKSQVTCFLAARVTRGGPWPDGAGHAVGGGQVVILTAEDDTADTLRPRLEAAGADLDRVHIVDGVIRGYSGDATLHQRMFSLETDLAALDRKLTELERVELVSIDPISAYLGKIDSHNNAEVRGALGPLKELAERHGAAFVGVSHLNKAGGTQALLRVTGSLAFIAAARAGYLVAADPQDNGRKLFLPLKNNLAKPQPGLAYRFEENSVPSVDGPIETSRVVWEDALVTMTADEVMSQADPEEASALKEARDWLKETLADGPVSSAELDRQAKAIGISIATLRRAKQSLKVRAKKRDGPKGAWNCELPNAQDAQDAQEFMGTKVSALPASTLVEEEI
jgi:hypothetical protein